MFFDQISQIPTIAKRTSCAIFVVSPYTKLKLPNALTLTPAEDKQTPVITVEQIREFIALTNSKETSERFFIIAPADAMNEAAENAFKEINSRVKKIYHILDPTSSIPDGKDVMNKVFTPNNPMLELCDRSTDSGQNIQLGFKEMFSGSMSALRNPKAHDNIQLTSDDAMRQIIFASMLMYKIDDGLSYSHVSEI